MKKVALVIGNGKYEHTSPLKNPVNDARKIKDALSQIGFDVDYLEDTTLRDFRRTLREFSDKAVSSEMTLFYYAGHGLQAQGENFLVPVDADIRAEDEIPDLTVSLSRIEQRLSDAKPRLALFILDACRNNPFESQMQSYARSRDIPVNLERGLSNRHIRFATQSLIAYATAPGEVAQDNPQEDHGIYTKHLLKYLTQPGLSVEHVFKRTAKDVTTSTAYAQQPWVHGNLFDEFYFTPKPQAPKPAEPPKQEPPKQPNTPTTFRLTLRPKPIDAVVTIKEVPNYFDGIALKPGSYDYTVSHEHCEPHEGTVHLQRDIEIPVALKCQKGSKVPYLSVAAVILLLAAGGWYASRVGGKPPQKHKEKKEVKKRPEKKMTEVQTTNGGLSPTLQPTVQTPPEPTTFSLSVKPTPSDASVYITNIGPKYQDGMKLEKGNYDIKVERKGYKSYQETITLTSNLTYPVTLEALPDPVAHITANVKASVYVDDAYKGTTPLDVTLPRDEHHRITLKKENYEAASRTVSLKDDKTLDFTLKQKTYSFTVRPTPSDANVYIMNIEPKYQDGIKLEKGEYDIKVVKSGYKTHRETITLSENRIYPVTLEALPQTHSLTHHGVTYGTVKSPYTGKIWLDRNLGAQRVCQSYNDEQCYGDYYQWGRDADGHEKPRSNSFKIGSSDWSSQSASQREAFWRRTDGSGICPKGYRVPTINELKTETVSNGVENRNDAFRNFLKLPASGLRGYDDGDLHAQGSHGYLWSSSPLDSYAWYLYWASDDANAGGYYRANGWPVRCLRD